MSEASAIDRLAGPQYLIMEVLGSRWRLGESSWTFPSRLIRPVQVLEELGYVEYKSGIAPKTLLVWFTDVGRKGVLDDDYRPPYHRQLVQYLEVHVSIIESTLENADDPRMTEQWIRGMEHTIALIKGYSGLDLSAYD